MNHPDARLLAIFQTEQGEHLQRIREVLSGAAPERPALEEALRRAHTLKGAARAVGLGGIEVLAHRLEAVFARVRDGAAALDGNVRAAVDHAMEAIEDVLAAVLENRGAPDVAGVTEAIEAVLQSPGTRAAEAPQPDGKAGSAPAPAAPTAPQPADTVRVNAASIDELVRSCSQLVAAIAGQQADLRHSGEIQQRLREFEAEMDRLRREWTKSLRHLRGEAAVAELFDDLDRVKGLLDALGRLSRTGAHSRLHRAWMLEQLGTRVYQDACRARTVPAGSVFDPFGSMVRELAREEGKEVEFRFTGHEVEADRLVLQKLKDPVMHLLRNAVSHGIERPGERAAAGKPRAGAVELRIKARGSRLRISVEDDGRGIDTARVAEVAVAKGLLAKDAAAGQSPQELARLILLPGFSTAAAVSRLSGRGMGLSVVQEQAAALGGEVLLRQEPGRGTKITLAAPLSISTHHVLLVASGEHTFALPAHAVGRLCRVRTRDIETVEGAEAVRIDGRPLLLARLADVIGSGGAAAKREDGEAAPVVVLRSGESEVGLVVDALVDERETVVKDTGLAASQAGMSAGAVMLDDGGVAVMLNPSALMARFRKGVKSPGLKMDAAEAAKPRPKVLVVDDSITTRSLEKSILEAHGYEVRVAVDGVEAIEALHEQPADLVITDVLMPRMDGFQLLEAMKKDARLAGTPVIVVTSLERPEEQERGLALGADAYIVKRKFDQRELLNTVRQII